MKKSLLVKSIMFLAFAFIAGNALAGGSTRPPSDGTGQTQCRAFDDGTEEHYGGHGSCNSCLSEHGGCEMRCYSYDYSCSATGLNQNGQKETVEAYGRRKNRVKNKALDRCYDSGLSNCRVGSCSEHAQFEDSYSCRDRRGPRDGGGRGRGRDRR